MTFSLNIYWSTEVLVATLSSSGSLIMTLYNLTMTLLTTPDNFAANLMVLINHSLPLCSNQLLQSVYYTLHQYFDINFQNYWMLIINIE